MITIVAKNIVMPDKIEAFKKLALELAEETRKEKGCVSYTLYQDIHQPEVFTLIEHWADQQAIDLHFKTHHFLNIVSELGKLQTEKTSVNLYKEV